MASVVANEKNVTLLDLLDCILDKGVILWGDITISVADVDLVYVGLKVLLTSIESAERMRKVATGDMTVAEAVARAPHRGDRDALPVCDH